MGWNNDGYIRHLCGVSRSGLGTQQAIHQLVLLPRRALEHWWSYARLRADRRLGSRSPRLAHRGGSMARNHVAPPVNSMSDMHEPKSTRVAATVTIVSWNTRDLLAEC